MLEFEYYAKYFKEYLTLALDKYSKYIPPIFVNYYSNTPVEFDITSVAGYNAPSDTFSPNRYIKYIGLPVYFSEPSSHPISSFDVKGVVEETSPFTITMMSSIGVKPKPDDHLVFPVFTDSYTTSSLYQVTNVEPVLALSADPYTEKYQMYKVTLILDNNVATSIEPKVVDTFFYIGKFHKFLRINEGEVYFTLADQARSIELYLLDSRDNFTLTWSPIKLVDNIYLVDEVVNLQFNSSSFNESVMKDYRITPSILESLCKKGEVVGSYYIEKLEKILPNEGIVSRRWWNRLCSITVDQQTNNTIFDFLYPNNKDEVMSYVEEIVSNYQNNTYEILLNNSHPLISIYNLDVMWGKSKRLPPTLPSYNNWFEAIYYYSVIKRIILELVG